VAFTGSTATGRTILRAAADSNLESDARARRQSPNIFFADASWEAAVEGAVFWRHGESGEVCSAGSRVLVERPIYAKFVGRWSKGAQHPARRSDGSPRRWARS
jgi:betaine-aldehyde dehydrogenase